MAELPKKAVKKAAKKVAAKKMADPTDRGKLAGLGLAKKAAGKAKKY